MTKMKAMMSLFVLVITAGLFATTANAKTKVMITPKMASLTVKHTYKGNKVKKVRIMRNQNSKNKIKSAYALTSRACPPFCVQPINQFAPYAVETIDEIGILHYLKKMQKSSDYTLIDSRTSDWVFLKTGTIPGAVNIPWTKLNPAKGATNEQILRILEDEFNVISSTDGTWNFGNAKTLVLFCNGMWCGQSPSNIRTLLALGYPASKIKWYRGGMQAWETLSLTTVKSAMVIK